MERIRSGPRRSSSARWRSSDLIPSRHPLPSPPARFAEWRIGHPLRPPSRPLPPGPSLRHMSIAHDPPLHTSRRSPRLARDFPTGRKSGSVPPPPGPSGSPQAHSAAAPSSPSKPSSLGPAHVPPRSGPRGVSEEEEAGRLGRLARASRSQDPRSPKPPPPLPSRARWVAAAPRAACARTQ